MGSDYETVRLELKRKEVEALYYRQLHRAEELLVIEKKDRQNLKAQAAAFDAIKEGLMRTQQSGSAPALKVRQVDFKLARLQKQSGRVAQAARRLGDSSCQRIEHGVLAGRHKLQLEKLSSALETSLRARDLIRESRDQDALAEQLAVRAQDEIGRFVEADQNSAEEVTDNLSEKAPASMEQLTAGTQESAGCLDQPASGGCASFAGQMQRGQGEGAGEVRSPWREGGTRQNRPRKECLNWFTAQIAAIDSWEGLNGSGVELEYVNPGGRRARVIVRRSPDELVNVCLMPEFESDRRALWMEKRGIISALESRGLKVGQVAIRKGEPALRVLAHKVPEDWI